MSNPLGRIPRLTLSVTPLYRASGDKATLPHLTKYLLNLDPNQRYHRETFSCWSGQWIRIATLGYAWQCLYQGQSSINRAQDEWAQISQAAKLHPLARELPQGLKLPLALGSFPFKAASTGVLFVPALAVLWNRGQVWLIRVENATQTPHTKLPTSWRKNLQTPTSPTLDSQTWKKAVAQASSLIKAGRAEKIVLARDQLVNLSKPVEKSQVVGTLAEHYPTCWTYAIGDLLGATPEMLSQVRDGNLLCRVLAGTCPPGREENLENDPKERCEHHIAVESAEENLRPFSPNLQISKPYLLRLPNVTHLASDLQATKVGLSALQVASRIHPTAAVCGKPREVAAHFLSELEQLDRGRFAGPIGWIDASGNGEWGLALRCAQVDFTHPKRFRLLAGAGIMGDSIPAKELQETESKMLPVAQALGYC